MKINALLILLLSIVWGFGESCNPALVNRLADTHDWDLAPPLAKSPRCFDTDEYIPDTNHLGFWPVKYIQTNYHVVDRIGQRMNMDSTVAPI